jgi:flagellar M-ring protein FliF
MEFLRKIVLIWQKINPVQRILMIAVCLASVIIGWFLIHWAGKPDMRMLYQELPPAEASKITDKISGKNIAYELRDGGTTIYVPKEHVYQLRLDLAKDGLPTGQQSGYKIFDGEKIGVSPFVQNINLKRALEEELAQSIQMIDGVLHARIHIVSQEQRLFSSDSEQTTASVVLRLRPGYQISGFNIAAITHLVSGSVKGLKPENVTVIDSQGRLLSGESDSAFASGAGTVQDYKERVEQSLAKKAEDMLTTVLGPDRATVRVSAIIDMNSVSTVKETYDPASKVPTKEESKTNKETRPGTGAQGAAASNSQKTDETTVTEYEVGKTVKQEVALPGMIKSLSVAAFVDLSPADANQTAAAGQPTTIMDVTEIEQIIRNALGLKETDALKVVNTKFHRAQPLPEEKPSNWPRYIALAQHLSMGIMAICALIVLKIFSGARKKASAQAASKQLSGAEAAATGFLPSGETSAEPFAMRRQIASAMQSNPDQVRQIFSSWIQEKE